MLLTDFWVQPGSIISGIPGSRRIRDRWHPDLAQANVFAPNYRMLAFEARERLKKSASWDRILRRNAYFQKQAIARLAGPNLPPLDSRPSTLFSYSYAALELFRFAKSQGMQTVLGQIDPGPEEERIVAEEHRRYAHLKTGWQPAPKIYWDSWREETRLADRIIVNSKWSRECLAKEGVPDEKMEIVPLVYEEKSESGYRISESGKRRSDSGVCKGETQRQETRHPLPATRNSPLRLLFLGQINLRKGVGRLLDAMRLMKGEPVQLTLVGPTEIDPAAWVDLPNVKWLGPAARSDVTSHYRAADVFVLPTLSDGFALTQLEALACGLPVMFSRHCGAAATDGVNGTAIGSLEPEDLAEVVLKFARSPARPESNVVPGQFSLDDLARRLAGLPEQEPG